MRGYVQDPRDFSWGSGQGFPWVCVWVGAVEGQGSVEGEDLMPCNEI